MSPQVETSSLGGLTVLRADSAVGRNMAALVFRVGRFDETLATAGITHLVEHLALAGKDEAPYNFNASVGGRFTTFFMESADPRDVGDFVSTVCDGLTVDHRAGLEQEKRILRTEAASRGNAGALGVCLANRYGAQGPGLLGYEEFGLHRLGWDEFDAWRRRWFVSGNAVLWVAGTIPDELRVDLPSGSQPADAAPRPLPIDLPGYFVSGGAGNGSGGSGGDGIGISATGPRSQVTAVTVRVLQQRLTKVLRHERGLSYNVQAIGQDLYKDQAHLWLAADTLPDQVSITAHATLGTIERLASEGCTDEEIQDYTRRFRDACQSPNGPAMMLDGHAQDLLEHRPPQDADEKLRLLSVLSPDAVGSTCGELLTQAIVVTPRFVPAVDGRMPSLPAWSPDTVTGTSTMSRDSGRSLTIGPDGVMLTAGEGKQVTARFGALAAWLRWNDNKRALIGEDGFVLQIDPAEWPDGDQLVASVDARIDPRYKIDIDTPGPQRSAQDPAPAPPGDSLAAPPDQQAGQARPAWGLLGIIGSVLLALVGIVVIATAIASTSSRHQAEKPPSGHASGGATTVGPLSLYQLLAGDCLRGPGLGLTNDSSPWPAVVTAVPCTQLHTAEVFFAGNIWPGSQSYPGDNAINNEWDGRCLAAFRTYDGIAQSASSFQFTGTAPDEADWDSGGRMVVCVAYEPSMSGSGAVTVDYSIKGSRQ